jgi:hypothetical protein
MRSAVIAALAVLACVAAAPASAQTPAPDPDATINVTVSCVDGTTMFHVLASGLNPGESYGVLVEDDEGVGQLGATATDVTGPDGSFEAGFGAAPVPGGTYTVYGYTGVYQNLADESSWPGSVEVDSFDPSLTTSYVSTTVEANCGPGTKEECKMGAFADAGYRNQGQCVSTFARK